MSNGPKRGCEAVSVPSNRVLLARSHRCNEGGALGEYEHASRPNLDQGGFEGTRVWGVWLNGPRRHQNKRSSERETRLPTHARRTQQGTPPSIRSSRKKDEIQTKHGLITPFTTAHCHGVQIFLFGLTFKLYSLLYRLFGTCTTNESRP